MHTTKLLAVSAAMTAIAACAPEHRVTNDYDVFIDPAFSAPQMELVLQAVKSWEDALPELHLAVTIGACPVGRPDVICVTSAHAHVLADCAGDQGVWGGCTNRDWTINAGYVTLGNTAEYEDPYRFGVFGKIAVHEIGHALGLQHSHVAYDVMFFDTSGFETMPAAPSCRDANQYRSIRGEATTDCAAVLESAQVN